MSIMLAVMPVTMAAGTLTVEPGAASADKPGTARPVGYPDVYPACRFRNEVARGASVATQ
jgi:hypothetical protein